MAGSAEEVANIALGALGVADITSLVGNHRSVKAVNRVLVPTRNKILRECEWNFAMKRAQLAEDATPPIFGFEKRYELPADFLYLSQNGGDSDLPLGDPRYRSKGREYELEGGFVLTNIEAPLNIVYVSVVTDISKWDDSIIQAWALMMARDMCVELKGTDLGLYDRMEARAKINLAEAKRFDGMQGDVQYKSEAPLLQSRRGRRLY